MEETTVVVSTLTRERTPSSREADLNQKKTKNESTPFIIGRQMTGFMKLMYHFLTTADFVCLSETCHSALKAQPMSYSAKSIKDFGQFHQKMKKKDIPILGRLSIAAARIVNFRKMFRVQIGYYSNLHELRLLNMNISEDIYQLSYLETLKLNQCTGNNFNFENMYNLKCLCITKCDIHQISFGNYLKKLVLIDCGYLKKIANTLSNTHLEELIVENAFGLTSICDTFGPACKLRILKLESCNYLESLPDDFGNCSFLERIEIIGCHHLSSKDSIPRSVIYCNRLKEIYLKYYKRDYYLIWCEERYYFGGIESLFQNNIL